MVFRKGVVIMKLFFVMFLSWLYCSTQGWAVVLDLQGENRTISSFDAVESIINSSTTQAVLTIDLPSDLILSNNISGNIQVVKRGEGTLWVATNLLQSGGMLIQGGRVVADSDVSLCAEGSEIVVKNATISFTNTFAQSPTRQIQFLGESTLDLGEGVEMHLANRTEAFCASNAVIRKTGPGMLVFYAALPSSMVRGMTLDIVEGTVQTYTGDLLGSASTPTPHQGVTLREGTRFLISGSHMPVHTFTLQGGEILSTRYFSSSTNPSLADRQIWRNFSLNGRMTVKASSSPSLIRGATAHFSHTDMDTIFDVQEGAELILDVPLSHGMGVGTVPKRWQMVTKTGKGLLRIKRPWSLNGMFVVDEGTVVLSKKAYFQKGMRIFPRAGARIRLEDGTDLTASLLSPVPFLSDAEIWVDASRMVAQEGVSLSSIPNLGSLGGAYQKFKTSIVPYAPTFTKTGIGGLPSFSFDGRQSLFMNYTNKSTEISTYLVFQWDSWENEGGKGKWGGPFSFCSVSTPTGTVQDDFSSVGSIHYSFGSDTANKIAVHLGQKFWGYTLQLDTDLVVPQTPLLCTHRESQGRAEGTAYWSDQAGEVKSIGTSESSWESLQIEATSLGSRMRDDGAAIIWNPGNPNGSANRALIGKIGEWLVFSRKLSDEEDAAVKAYLKRKWFSSEIAEQPFPANEGEKRACILDVMAGATSFAGGNLEKVILQKEGEGTLFVTETQGLSSLSVEEGRVVLGTTNTLPLAAVWIDPSDSNSVELSEGRVVSIRNKGTCGGVFSQNLRGDTPPGVPEYLTAAMNGNAVLSFDGNTALALDGYVNEEAYRNLHFYGIFRRTAWENEGGKGKWGGPFSFYDTDEAKQDQEADVGFHWEEVNTSSGANVFSFVMGRNLVAGTIENVGTGTNYLFVSRQYYNGYLCEVERESDALDQGLKCDSMMGLPPFRVNLIQLGGRVREYGKAQWDGVGNTGNRMWSGWIGEVIAFHSPLSLEQEEELLGYLRKKWFNKGDGSVTSPVMLTGERKVSSLPVDVSLSVSNQAALVSCVPSTRIGNLILSDGAKIVRDSIPDESPLFSVSNLLSLSGSLMLEMNPMPKTKVPLFTYGMVSDTATWVVADAGGVSVHVENRPAESAVFVIPQNGLLLILR